MGGFGALPSSAPAMVHFTGWLQCKEPLKVDLILVVALTLLGLMIFGLVNVHWRSGIFIILGVGFVQDVFRKLAPDQPVAISATVAVVMLFVWVVGLNRFGGVRELELADYYPSLVRVLMLFTG